MIYSVFNYHKKQYDYFEAAGSISPVAKMRKPKGSFSKRADAFGPQSLAVAVPVGARKVGSGPEAKGLIAQRGLSLDSFLPEESRPSLGWTVLLLTLGVGGGYFLYSRKRR